MRITRTASALMLAATAGIVLAGCSADTGADASPSASAAAAELNVGDLLANVKAAAGCDAWTGGKVAGEGVIAGWEYVCDADGDSEPDATLTIYTDAESRDAGLAAIESADASSGVVLGDAFVFVTSDPDELAAVAVLGEVVREPAA